MTRLLHAFSALTISCGIFGSVAAMPTQPPPARAGVIGADRPVNLGRMVVTATAL